MSAILSFAGWTFVPNLASGFIHHGLMRLFPTSLAMPGSRSYGRDRRIIYIVVVVSYLMYTLYRAYVDLPVNFYETLGVPLDVGEKKLRTGYRRLSAIHHPDKGGDEDLFRTLRVAYDTLSDPVTRFAYDRFGPAMLNWERCKTYFDYMERGFRMSLPFYVGSTAFIFLLAWFQNTRYAAYWRGLSFVTLAASNLVITTSPTILPTLKFLLPGKLQFQQVAFLQSVSVTLLIAISQVGPALFPPQPDPNSQQVLEETATIAKLVNLEATQTLQLTHLPFPKNTSAAAELYDATATWMMQAKINQDPEVVAVRQQLQSATTTTTL